MLPSNVKRMTDTLCLRYSFGVSYTLKCHVQIYKNGGRQCLYSKIPLIFTLCVYLFNRNFFLRIKNGIFSVILIKITRKQSI